MFIPETPSRLNMNAISKHLLGAKTNWQNVQEEAAEGCASAQDMVLAQKKNHTISVEMLKVYLVHLESRKNVLAAFSDTDLRNDAVAV